MKRAVFDQLMKRIEDSFSVALIAQPLLIHDSSDPEALRELAKNSRYSQVHFRVGSHNNMMVREFDATRGFETIGDSRPISHYEIIADSTPLAELIHLLVARPYYLVLVRDKIRMVVTCSDLNQLPVRTYLFTVISHLEALLTEWISSQFVNDGFMSLLSTSQKDAVTKLFQHKAQQDLDTSIIDCTTLTHKLVIVQRTPEMYRQLGYASSTKFSQAYTSLNRLRNRLSHGQTPLPRPSLAVAINETAMEDEIDVDGLRDALAHNGQLIVDHASVEWLSNNVNLMHVWINRISKVLVHVPPEPTLFSAVGQLP